MQLARQLARSRVSLGFEMGKDQIVRHARAEGVVLSVGRRLLLGEHDRLAGVGRVVARVGGPRGMATYILFMHLVDMYWLVWPAYDSTGPSFHWTLVTAFFGGLAVGAFADGAGVPPVAWESST